MDTFKGVRVDDVLEELKTQEEQGQINHKWYKQMTNAVRMVYKTVYGDSWEVHKIGDPKEICAEYKQKVLAEEKQNQSTATSYMNRCMCALNRYAQILTTPEPKGFLKKLFARLDKNASVR